MQGWIGKFALKLLHGENTHILSTEPWLDCFRKAFLIFFTNSLRDSEISRSIPSKFIWISSETPLDRLTGNIQRISSKSLKIPLEIFTKHSIENSLKKIENFSKDYFKSSFLDSFINSLQRFLRKFLWGATLVFWEIVLQNLPWVVPRVPLFHKTP